MPAHFGLGISMLMIGNLPKGSTHLVSDQTAGWSAVRDCGISYPKSLAFFTTIYLAQHFDSITKIVQIRFRYEPCRGKPCLRALRPGESHTYACSTTITILNLVNFDAAYITINYTSQ